MHKLTVAAQGFLASCIFSTVVFAEQIDNTQTLPDAKPGECYAKVITPPVFETVTEEVVLQEESVRIESVDAVYESVDQAVVVKEAAENLIAIEAQFEPQTVDVETQAAELQWTSSKGDEAMPAAPDALAMVAQSGIDLDAVEPGSCFVEYYTEARYETETEEVLIKEAYEVITVLPPEYEEAEERVLVKEESTKVIDVPAVYRTVTESVLVEPARSTWKEGCGMVEQVANTTGETMCMVQVPARYETLTKTVLDTPATTKTVTVPAVYETIAVQKLVNPARERREQIPAEYTTVSRQVKVADPVFFWLAEGVDADEAAIATGREICLNARDAEYTSISQQLVSTPAAVSRARIPAAFETIKVQRLKTPATEDRIVIPARTKMVSTQRQVEPSRLEWRRVLCEINMTPQTITAVQLALQREGYDPGPIDGIPGDTTMSAMEQFQTDQGIDRRGLTYEALQLLKVVQ